MNADDCWLIYAYRSLSGSLRTAYYCYITTPAPSLTSPASSSPALSLDLSLSLLPLSLPSIPLLLLLFRTPASFFHHCAGHTSSLLLSFSLSLLTISLLTLLCLFFFSSLLSSLFNPLHCLIRNRIPPESQSKRSIQSIYQTDSPYGASYQQSMRLWTTNSSSSCLVFRVKGIRNAL